MDLASCGVQKGYQYGGARKHQFQHIPFYQSDWPRKQPAYLIRFEAEIAAAEGAMPMGTSPKAYYCYYSSLCFGPHGAGGAAASVLPKPICFVASLTAVASVAETATTKKTTKLILCGGKKNLNKAF